MRKHRFIHTAALALALCAFTAPVASATTDFRSPDTRDSANGYSPSTKQDLRSPDARDAGYAPSTQQVVQDLRSPDSRDVAAGRQVPEVTVVKVAQPSPSASSGLDWGDAVIGAGLMLGLILLGVGTIQVVKHRRPAIGG